MIALLGRRIDFATKDEVGNPALHVAAGMRGNVKITERLLQAGSDIDARGGNWATALHHAPRIAELKTVQLLLDKMADPTVVDRNGRLASNWAPGHAGRYCTNDPGPCESYRPSPSSRWEASGILELGTRCQSLSNDTHPPDVEGRLGERKRQGD